MEKLLEEGNQFFTAENVNINSRIKKGLTIVSQCRKQSEETAKQMRSYVYEVFTQEKKTTRPVFFGYAVPK